METAPRHAGPVRLAIVGAGAHFTPGLLMGVARRADLAGAEVALYDLDSGGCARRPLGAAPDPRARAHFTVRRATAGRDVARRQRRYSTTIGRRRGARASTWKRRCRHGLSRWATPWARRFAYALRQVPAFLNIARTMERAARTRC
jgi:alpha-galactosidase/6-phospho-beta-glucosidase family protein